MAILSRVFSVSPRVQKRAGRLEASPSWRAQVLTLGFGHRRVIVDPAAQAVIIQTRKFWLFSRRRRIPFKAVSAVIYAYFDASMRMPWEWATDTSDVFVVALKQRDGAEVVLFRSSAPENSRMKDHSRTGVTGRKLCWTKSASRKANPASSPNF